MVNLQGNVQSDTASSYLNLPSEEDTNNKENFNFGESENNSLLSFDIVTTPTTPTTTQPFFIPTTTPNIYGNPYGYNDPYSNPYGTPSYYTGVTGYIQGLTQEQVYQNQVITAYYQYLNALNQAQISEASSEIQQLQAEQSFLKLSSDLISEIVDDTSSAIGSTTSALRSLRGDILEQTTPKK